MTDSQLLTLALAVIIPLSLLIYSNGRIAEAKETLRAEVASAKHDLRAEIATLRGEMATGFARIEAAVGRIENQLAIHELEHHK